jgi:hypothetical protein
MLALGQKAAHVDPPFGVCPEQPASAAYQNESTGWRCRPIRSRSNDLKETIDGRYLVQFRTLPMGERLKIVGGPKDAPVGSATTKPPERGSRGFGFRVSADLRPVRPGPQLRRL